LFGWCGMRRWLPPILWLLAWSFWVRLGFGLARELPRDLTPTTRLGMVWGSDKLLGFLPGDDAIATQGPEDWIRIWDAHTGEKINEWPGPHDSHDRPTRFSVRHGVAICCTPQGDSNQYVLLNLRNGHRTPIEDRLWSVQDFHPTKPWAVGAIVKAERT